MKSFIVDEKLVRFNTHAENDVENENENSKPPAGTSLTGLGRRQFRLLSGVIMLLMSIAIGMKSYEKLDMDAAGELPKVDNIINNVLRENSSAPSSLVVTDKNIQSTILHHPPLYDNPPPHTKNDSTGTDTDPGPSTNIESRPSSPGGASPDDDREKKQRQDDGLEVGKETASSLDPKTSIDTGVTKNIMPSNSNSSDTANITTVAERRVAEQFKNYRNSIGLMLNIHITHHGGTTFCGEVGNAPDANGDSPKFACMGIKESNNVPDQQNDPGTGPWSHAATELNIDWNRRYFHMRSWEFSSRHKIPLTDTDWENPKLLSVIVLRDPISRLLAGDGRVSVEFPGLLSGNGTLEQWWQFAKHDRNANNYALKVLSSGPCCDGENTDPERLEEAKRLVGRFSVVLDIACLDQGMQALAKLGNFTLKSSWPKRRRWRLLLDEDDDDPIRHRRASKSHIHKPTREHIGHDDVYDYLVRRNHLDVELYEWSKSISLVKCTDLLPRVRRVQTIHFFK